MEPWLKCQCTVRHDVQCGWRLMTSWPQSSTSSYCSSELHSFNGSFNAYTIGWQWRNFFIWAVFRHFVRQGLRNVCYFDVSRRHFLNKIVIVKNFLKPTIIQIYSNNATNLHHLTTHSMTCWCTKWRLHCDHRYVTSLHPMYFTTGERS